MEVNLAGKITILLEDFPASQVPESLVFGRQAVHSFWASNTGS